jgi:alpha-tubulin suppressor-like RCC1 family protein
MEARFVNHLSLSSLFKVAAFGALALVITGGCVGRPQYTCTDNTQCIDEDGTQGICEPSPTSLCAFPVTDPTKCPDTGLEYPDGAGSLAGTCVQKPACTNPVTYLDVGAEHSCVLRSDGAVYCWGLNDGGQVGDGTTAVKTSPTKVVGLPSAAVDLSAGEGETCAVVSDGTVWCWGDNSTLALGQCNGDTIPNSATPVQVKTFTYDANTKTFTCGAPLANVKNVEVGGKHACVLDAQQNVYCWGENSHGQCGLPTAVADDVPGAVTVQGLDGTTTIGAGDDYSCARKDDGTVRCWGSNALGSLGDGTGGASAPDNPTPVSAAGILSAGSLAADFGMDDETACVRNSDGSLYCWGDASTGIFGQPGTSQASPVRLMSVAAVFGGCSAKHMCVVDGQGNLGCWGANLKGQTGTGSTDPTVNLPASSGGNVVIPSAHLVTVTNASLGEEHSCAMTRDGSLWCWGDDSQGELGIGLQASAPILTPTRVTVPCD